MPLFGPDPINVTRPVQLRICLVVAQFEMNGFPREASVSAA